VVNQAGSTPDANTPTARGEVLAIIPARGGSKSIPHKNIKLLGGFPLIAYSITIARQAPNVSRVIVSTDDEKIAEVAREWGADVPFRRPEEISRDETTDLPVFQHALQWLQEHENYVPEIVIQLRPTSPFRRLSHIEDSIRLLRKNQNADSVRTVCTPFQNPFKMWTIESNSFLKPLLSGYGDEPYNQPRQSLPQVFWQTGYVDAIRPQVITNGSMSGTNILPLVIDDGDWIDIDSPADWQMAENLLQAERIKTEALGFSMTGVLPS
jgi:N-acylneuraminate cytidylyltransferase